MQIRTSFLFGVALSTCVLLVACANNQKAEPIDDFGLLRVVNASPDASAVDIFAVSPSDNELIGTLEYGQASGYVPLPIGEYRIKVFVAGTDILVDDSDTFNLFKNHKVTSVAMGLTDTTSSAARFRVVSFEEGFDSTNTGQARIRFVNAVPDAGPISIDIGNNGSFEITRLPRFGDSSEDGQIIRAGVFAQVGVGVSDALRTAFTTPVLAEGSDIFAIATGFAGLLPRDPLGFSLLLVGPGGTTSLIAQNPTVYALNAAPDSPALDVRVLGTDRLLFSDLGFGDLIPAQVPPGDLTLAFFRTRDQTTQVGGAQLLGLAAGERYLMVASGMLTPLDGEPRFGAALYVDRFAFDGLPRLVAIHASPDTPALDISLLDPQGLLTTPPTIASNLGYLQASSREGTVVPSLTNLGIGIAQTGSVAPIARFSVDTTAPPKAFAVVAGALTPTPDEQSLRLFVVDTAALPLWTLTTDLPL